MPRELSNPLTEDDKAWLRSWNREDEIPTDDAEQPKDPDPTPSPDPTPNPEQQTNDDDGSDAEIDADDPFGGQPAPDDYNDWTVPQLQYELGQRKLPKTGNKPDLVARLVQDDEDNPE